MLELKNITKVYETGNEKVEALKGVSIKFRKSEFVSILGQSGCGKTTLLNIIGGLDRYTSGDLIINGKSTKKFKDRDWDAYRNYKVGFVFQSYNLIGHQTILSNVELALTIGGISKKERSKRAIKALEEVGLKDQIHKKPNQLSGGQMQRVAIARALVNNPDIILADEPTGALDTKTSIQVMEILKKISKDKLIVMVTHNPDLAENYSSRIIRILDGTITEDSNPIPEQEIVEKVDDVNIGRTSMSFWTAFRLSLNNLLTKKGRTVLVAFAGSIGIIGIALVQSVSNGFQAYVDKIQEDTLTSYPLTIMEEATDVAGTLLAMTTQENKSEDDSKEIKEEQYISKMLANLSTNDLKSFNRYFNENYKNKDEDISTIKFSYNVEPTIYTIDATQKLVKINPSNYFSSAFGTNTIMSAYTSVYSQMMDDKKTLEETYDVIAGTWPQNYNEMVIVLSQRGSISDLLLYSLGLKDTSQMKDIMGKLMNGENVEIPSEPLTLTYEDLMNVDLRLIMGADTYKYNEKYGVYEDMTEDEAYMRNLYDNGTKLKIVGIVTAKEGVTTMALNPGVAYTKDLVDHIIDYASETDIVKRQLDNEEIDVLSGTRFDDPKNKVSLDFNDLVSIDSNKLRSAFGISVDENKMQTEIEGYINKAIDEAAANSNISYDGILEKIKESIEDLPNNLPERPNGTYTQEEIENYINSIDTNEIKNKIISEISKVIMKQAKNMVSNISSSAAIRFNVNQAKIASAFKMKMSEEELARVMSAMLTTSVKNAKTNLVSFGYQGKEEPTYMSVYFKSFDGKENFKNFINDYNKNVKKDGEDDKEITYTDTTGILMSSVKTIVNAVTYVLIAFISISLVVSSMMIGIITYISVYERTKEIGILRAIGASKHNISSIFNAETFIIGLLSGLFGIGVTYLVVPIANKVLHHFTGNIPLYFTFYLKNAITLVILSVILTIIGGLIPAKAASKKDPVIALRTE